MPCQRVPELVGDLLSVRKRWFSEPNSVAVAHCAAQFTLLPGWAAPGTIWQCATRVGQYIWRLVTLQTIDWCAAWAINSQAGQLVSRPQGTSPITALPLPGKAALLRPGCC